MDEESLTKQQRKEQGKRFVSYIFEYHIWILIFLILPSRSSPEAYREFFKDPIGVGVLLLLLLLILLVMWFVVPDSYYLL